MLWPIIYTKIEMTNRHDNIFRAKIWTSNLSPHEKKVVAVDAGQAIVDPQRGRAAGRSAKLEANVEQRRTGKLDSGSLTRTLNRMFEAAFFRSWKRRRRWIYCATQRLGDVV